MEYVEQLRNQMEKNFSAPVMEDLFHKNDFKCHIKAIEALIKVRVRLYVCPVFIVILLSRYSIQINFIKACVLDQMLI